MSTTLAQTSCDSFTFEYQWTVKNLRVLVHSQINNSELSKIYAPDAIVQGPEITPGLTLGSEEAKFSLVFRAWPMISKYLSHTCPNETTSETKSRCTCVCLQVRVLYKPKEQLFAGGEISIKAPSCGGGKDVDTEALHEVETVKFPPGWISNNKLEANAVISQQELLTGSSKFTHHDSFTVHFSMTVYKVEALVHGTEELSALPQLDLAAALDKDRTDRVLTDVTIVCGKKRFDVHRAVIGCHSVFFKTKLERWETKDKTIDMSDLDPEIVEAIINYMYTGKAGDIASLASTDLLAATEKYQLHVLKSLVEIALIKSLTPSNALSLLKMASTHSASNLRRKALEIINPNPMPEDIVKALTN